MSCMSCGDSGAAMPCMIEFCRSPLLNFINCVTMYCSFSPASLGYCASVELPSMPWQAPQAAALPCPAVASPGFTGVASSCANCAVAALLAAEAGAAVVDAAAGLLEVALIGVLAGVVEGCCGVTGVCDAWATEWVGSAGCGGFGCFAVLSCADAVAANASTATKASGCRKRILIILPRRGESLQSYCARQLARRRCSESSCTDVYTPVPALRRRATCLRSLRFAEIPRKGVFGKLRNYPCTPKGGQTLSRPWTGREPDTWM